MDGKVLESIKKAFSNGCPNGFLLGWDEKRFFERLSALLSGTKVINNTDFNYSYCNSFEVLLDELEEKEHFVLTVKVSFVADFFCVYLTKYTRNKRNGEVVDVSQSEDFSELFGKVESFFAGEGFRMLNDNEMNNVVDGVDLELAEDATVAKCLFDDFE